MTPTGGRLGTVALLLPAALVGLLAFIVPLVRLVGLSFSAPAGPLDAYAHVLGDDIYRQVFANTLVIAFTVTLIALLIAFPIAFALTRLQGGWRTLVFACVLLPLWISVLVRTFSWMLVLERNGPVNRLLVGSGLIDAPLSLLFNQTGVLIGMVHVLLPYMIFPLYAVMRRVDPGLLSAAEGLGAPGWQVFRRVYLPLTLPGVLAGVTLVFILSIGFFITPALLGGGKVIMIAVLIESQVRQFLAWDFAAALSVVLLAMTLLVYFGLRRLFRGDLQWG